MRLRAALLTAGMAVLAVGALSAPAHAAGALSAPAQAVSTLSAPAQAAGWVYIGHYNKAKCIEYGTQYVREGFNEYECKWIAAQGMFSLRVR